jgi:hypothetical protein
MLQYLRRVFAGGRKATNNIADRGAPIESHPTLCTSPQHAFVLSAFVPDHQSPASCIAQSLSRLGGPIAFILNCFRLDDCLLRRPRSGRHDPLIDPVSRGYTLCMNRHVPLRDKAMQRIALLSLWVVVQLLVTDARIPNLSEDDCTRYWGGPPKLREGKCAAQ